MRTFVSTPASLFCLVVLGTACGCDSDKPKEQPAKSAAANAKGEAKAEPKAEAEPGKDPQAAAAEAFAASRDAKVVEVTAKPGTPEWFVQGLAAFRSGNVDPIVSNFATDIVWDAVGSPIEPPSKGREAVQARWEDLLTAIPDMKLHARRIFHRDDLVVMQVVLTGTHKGSFRGIAATDKALGAEVLAWVWHDKDGKAKQVKVVYNEAALLAQMGQMAGAPLPPVPEIPAGEPEVITGENDAAATGVVKQLYAAGKNSWTLCHEKLCAAGIVHHEQATGETVKTAEEHAAAAAMFYAAFPDLKPKVEEAVAFGPDWAVSFVRGKGTHKGAMGPIAATNKKVDLAYSEVTHFVEGKVAESWGYSNSLEMLAQLGLFQPPKVAESAAPYEGPPKVDEPEVGAQAGG